MKRGIGIVLVGLGVFLLALAALLKFTVVPAVAKAPLSPGEDTGGVTQTDQEGVAARLFDPATLTERTDVPLTATRFTRGDVPASQTTEALADDLAVYDSFLRTEDNTGTVISASTIRVAFNRVTSELANCCGANFDGNEVEFTGINPLKFPMFTQQQDYPYFDTTVKSAPLAVFQGTEEVEGLNTYRFQQVIEPTRVGELEVPGELVGAVMPSFIAPRFYAATSTFWVEPTTGAIVKGEVRQLQTLRGPDGNDAVTIIDAVIGTSPSEVTEGVEYAGGQARLINLLNSTVPLVAGILGVILLIVGIVLIATSGRRSNQPA